MDQISNNIDFALKDLRQAITESNREKRQYNKTSEYQYKPEQSRFKLVIWFHDGNKRTFYSYDNTYYDKIAHVDEWRAVIKLIDLTKKFAGTFKNAQIYATIDPDKKKESNYNYLVYWAKWNGDVEANSALTFKTEGKNMFAILNKLEMYSPKKYVK
jgi:hypothetical protein